MVAGSGLRTTVAGVTATPTGFLFTDHYQLTMAQLYLRLGLAERRATFDAFFRSYPDYGSHQAGYCVTAGLGPLLDWMGTTRVTETDREVLRAVTVSSGSAVSGQVSGGWAISRT